MGPIVFEKGVGSFWFDTICMRGNDLSQRQSGVASPAIPRGRGRRGGFVAKYMGDGDVLHCNSASLSACYPL